MEENFKPNIYPIIWWGLAFGLTAGILLYLVFILSRFVTLVWFPVFLAGLIWGGYRNYKQQKKAWQAAGGVATAPGSAISELKQAARDIASASQEVFAQEESLEAEDENYQPVETTPPASDQSQDTLPQPPRQETDQ